MKTDPQIQRDVMDQLRWSPILDAAAVGVAVKEGVVTLSGMVNTYAQKKAAEDAAKRVNGVRAVAAEINVGHSLGYIKTDTELAEAALYALKWHSTVPEDKIQVKVEHGMVTLEGKVEWQYQRASAQLAVENLSGVILVNNNITVNAKATPADIMQKIKAALYRTATVDANRISVDIIDHKVVLRGNVRSYAEKENALDAAWSAPGIVSVESQLQIVPEESLVL